MPDHPVDVAVLATTAGRPNRRRRSRRAPAAGAELRGRDRRRTCRAGPRRPRRRSSSTTAWRSRSDTCAAGAPELSRRTGREPPLVEAAEAEHGRRARRRRARSIAISAISGPAIRLEPDQGDVVGLARRIVIGMDEDRGRSGPAPLPARRRAGARRPRPTGRPAGIRAAARVVEAMGGGQDPVRRDQSAGAEIDAARRRSPRDKRRDIGIAQRVGGLARDPAASAAARGEARRGGGEQRCAYFFRLKSTETTLEPSSTARAAGGSFSARSCSSSAASSARAWNCSAKSTAGSTKPVIAEKGMASLAGAWLKRQPDLEAVVAHLEVPEAVLDDDGHLVGEFLGEVAGDVDARRRRS